jgi:hypothetical protein
MHLVFVQDATNFSVPEYVDVVSELKITPGCTYEIVVEASPSDGKRNASLNYTVPGRSILEVVGYAVKRDLNLRIKIFGKTKAERPEKRKPGSSVACRYGS